MYRYGIIGFGGLGKKHLCNLIKIEQKRKDICLAAICGTTKEEAKKNVSINMGMIDVSSLDFSGCNFYQDYKEMIDEEELDFILSVLPTFLHEEVAVYALSKGIHVFSEKPMALTVEGCENMIKAAKENGRELMIGQCLRFHTGFRKIKDYIESGELGKVRGAYFDKNSQMPCWTFNNWILDPKQSGGCPIDMHIHDVDLINWFFGKPNSLYSTVRSTKLPLEGIITQYFYDDFSVVAQADWSLPQTFPFDEICRIDFEKASIVVRNDKLSIYCDDKSFEEEYDAEEAFVAEIEAFLNMIIDKKPCDDITSPESICDTLRIAIAEIESAEKKTEIFF
ncbi:MAG: Gfo/Idh/MocA family oxidoreductase [Clostridia bacterium]|nr:Gfo/Idh/MocA family oxidoreductase [Clostridia bacterium]